MIVVGAGKIAPLKIAHQVTEFPLESRQHTG
jgi:hypothetical protein